ncbi:hypothetical protein PYW07_013959 [Mythimna separata]|uniref:Uncharacterized protein n=1 Tax=Mythimna separata TaxID=271217 RepID=A0AAD7YG49_MYTSE|nr:hypothetical protein PYW07_013959 [Mythimna separata]
MAGVLFIVNVPKKEYENYLKRNIVPNLIFEKEKYETATKLIHELKEKQLSSKDPSASENQNVIILSKCRSTDCLHENYRSDSFKCRSESSLADGPPDDRKNYVKASWEEIKQVIKPRKHKLTITRPVRGVDVLAAFHWDTPLETILSEIVERLDIKNAAWSSTKDDKFWQVIFSLESGHLSEELLQVLTTFGIGARHQSSVSVLPCALFYKSNEERSPPDSEAGSSRQEDTVSKTAWSRFSSSVRARTNLAQVLHDVRADAALTFDWVFLLLVAAFVAAIGLVENSTVILVASMLISPLMGPITAGTLGTAVRDRSLQLLGVKNEFLGLFLSLVMGFLFGLTICAIDERYGVVEDWPTAEMISRCEYRSLWVGILVAIPSGAGVALAVLGEYTSSLVGVAISASLLPPAVNAGLLWAMALTRLMVTSEDERWLVVQPSELAVLGTASLCLTLVNIVCIFLAGVAVYKTCAIVVQPSELAVLGTASLCLTLVNIVCIFLAGVAVYKVKEVSPLERKDISWWKANRTRMQTRQSKDNSNWDAYNKWYDEKSETTGESNEGQQLSTPTAATTPGLIDDSTVTFRRRPTLIKQLRAQNIEGYCHKAQLADIYIPLDLEIGHLETHTSKTGDSDNSTQILDSETDSKGTYSQNTEDLTHSYYNLGFEKNETVKVPAPQYPTIDPSQSYTVNAKNGVLLDNKSYDV